MFIIVTFYKYFLKNITEAIRIITLIRKKLCDKAVQSLKERNSRTSLF